MKKPNNGSRKGTIVSEQSVSTVERTRAGREKWTQSNFRKKRLVNKKVTPCSKRGRLTQKSGIVSLEIVYEKSYSLHEKKIKKLDANEKSCKGLIRQLRHKMELSPDKGSVQCINSSVVETENS